MQMEYNKKEKYTELSRANLQLSQQHLELIKRNKSTEQKYIDLGRSYIKLTEAHRLLETRVELLEKQNRATRFAMLPESLRTSLMEFTKLDIREQRNIPEDLLKALLAFLSPDAIPSDERADESVNSSK